MRTLAMSALLFLGCYDSQVMVFHDDIQALKRQNEYQRDINAELKAQMQNMEREIEHKVRDFYARANCTNTKVSDFLAECEKDSDVCSAEGVENALSFMSTQDYSTLYLDPVQGVASVSLVRKGQLDSLTEPKKLRQSTRFVVLVQPREETEASKLEAIGLGRAVLKFVRSDYKIPRHNQFLGPKILPCKLKAEKISKYMGRLDRVQVGEPTDAKERVRVWVFRTDC